MVSSRSASVTLAPNNGVATSREVVGSEGDSHATTANRMARGGGGDYNHHAGNTEDYVANGQPGGRGGGASEWSHSGPPSLSMSVDLHNLVSSSANLQDSGHFSSSPERGGTATPKLQGASHEEEESYEAFGSVDADPDDGIESHAGSSSTPSPTGGPNSLRNPRSPNSTIGRQTWLRTSLRRSQPGSGRKRLSSNALASQLYRSGSFNSLGRSVNCETTDDLYSDVSLEDDVIDLNQKPMNPPNPTCLPSPRPGPSSSSTRPQDNSRIPTGHPAHPSEGHPPPYGYYPPFYPRFNPYDFYLSHYYPVSSQQPACCSTELATKSSGSSRYIAILFLLLIICSLGCVAYRFICDSQQEARSRVITLTAPPSQAFMRRRHVDENYSPEISRCSGTTLRSKSQYSSMCENHTELNDASTSSPMRTKRTKSTVGLLSRYESDENLRRNFETLPLARKSNVATDISSIDADFSQR